MIKTRSDALIVWNLNTAAGAAGSNVSIVNSAGWIVSIANTAGMGVNIQNSAGWLVGVGSTSIVNSAGWVVSIANTAGWLVGVGSTSIVNSAGWVVGISNSAGWSVGVGSTSIVNSAGWVVAQSNTAGMTVNVINSAGWLVGASSTIMNSSRLVTTYDVTYAMDGTALVTMKYSTINLVASGNTVLVKAVSNSRIKVMSAFLISTGTGFFFWQSGSSSAVSIVGPTYLAANVGYVLPFNPNGWFQTGVATLLNGSLSTITTIGGCITYLETS